MKSLSFLLEWKKLIKGASTRYYFLAATIVIATLAGTVLNTFDLLNEDRKGYLRLMISVDFISLFLLVSAFVRISKGRTEAAGKLLIIYVILMGLTTSFVFTGVGLYLQVLVSLTCILIALEFFPIHNRSYGITIALVAGAIAFGMDFLPQLWRIPSLSSLYTKYSMFIAILVFIFYVFVNFQIYKVQTKLMFFFLGVNVLIIVSLTTITSQITRQFVTRSIEHKLSVSASGLADEIDHFLLYSQTELRIHSESQPLVDYLRLSPEARRRNNLEDAVFNLLNKWNVPDPDKVNSYALLNLEGVNIQDTNRLAIGNNESSFAYFSQPLQNFQPYLSPISKDSQEASVITFSIPVKDPRGVIGVLRFKYNTRLLNLLVRKFDLHGGPESFGLILDEKGNIIARGGGTDSSQASTADLLEVEIQTLQNKKTIEILGGSEYFPTTRNAKLSSNEIFNETHIKISGANVEGIAVIAPLTQVPWKSVYFQSSGAAYASMQATRDRIIAVSEGIMLLMIIISSLGAAYLTIPINRLTLAAKEFGQGNLTSHVDISSQDELGILAETFNQMVAELRTTFVGLEDRIQERTRSIEVSTEIGRKISTILDTFELANEVVYQLQMAFDYYHVELYLADHNTDTLIMAASSNTIGDNQLINNHQTPIGVGIVGRAAKNKSIILIQDLYAEPDWQTSLFTSEAKSVAALPIVLGNNLLGVLNVFQNTKNGLTAQDTNILKLITSQLATALHNAQLLENARKQAELEKRLSVITEAIRQNTDIDRSLKVAAREIGRSTSASVSYIRVRHSGR
jgi:GAF domain-containing protein